MIKDSKLIGTKIAAPFGWKKFKVGELFDYVSIRQIPSGFDSSPGNIPYLAQTSFNNSISKYISHTDDLVLNKGKAIVVGVDTQYATYQDISFYANKMIALYLSSRYNDASLNSCLGLYFCCIFNKKFLIYDYNRKLSLKRLLSLRLDIPVTSDNQPDFAWMSDYIKVVKADYLEQKALLNRNEIKAYLSAGNVDSTDITDDDRQFLRDFAKLPRRKFKVGELFDILTPLSKLNAVDAVFDNSQTGVNYVVRTNSNNGIRGKVSSDGIINVGGVLTLGQDTGTIFYQEASFITGDKIKILAPKAFHLTSEMSLFFVSLFQKQLLYFTWGSSSFGVDVLSDLELELPVIDSLQIDVDSIEKYMQIQSKPLIDKVAETLVPVGGGQP